MLKRIGSTDDAALIDKSTLFLLKNKDRYGVWYSTQTTINVLDGLLAGLKLPVAQTVTVTAGGALLKKIDVPADQIEPVVIDVTGKIALGSGLSVAGSADSQLMTQLVRSHYVAWEDSTSTNRDVNDSRAIELKYGCDKTAGKVMDEVKCSVSAGRVGFRGYGMLLAEIGIPPGADVSRESLDEAVNAGRISRYEVLPDRIVVYLWAIPGGAKFDFSFKPRYGINAQTPPSVLYDYYNEEARAVIAPMRFRFDD